MKNEIKNKKKKTIAISLLAIGIIILGTSYALYYNESNFVNTFKTMTYDVELEEEFNNEFGVKKVWITNKEETNTPVVLRLNFNETWSKTVNNETIYLNNLNGNYNCVYKEWTDAFLNDFVLGNDGWYYYKKVLKGKEKVTILNSIEDNRVCNYQNATYSLDFNYEAIQASKNAISEIWNENVTINNDNITWSFSNNGNPNRNQLRGS